MPPAIDTQGSTASSGLRKPVCAALQECRGRHSFHVFGRWCFQRVPQLHLRWSAKSGEERHSCHFLRERRGFKCGLRDSSRERHSRRVFRGLSSFAWASQLHLRRPQGLAKSATPATILEGGTALGDLSTLIFADKDVKSTSRCAALERRGRSAG
jgi:hypothetical protein